MDIRFSGNRRIFFSFNILSQKMMRESVLKKSFCVLLFFYLLYAAIMQFLFNPQSSKSVPWDLVYNWNWVVGVLGGLALAMLFIFFGAALCKSFWNNFLADVIQLRTINYDEALSITLVILILTL